MSKRALSRKSRKYHLKEDRDTKNHPVFTIRSLSAIELAEAQDLFMGEIPIKIKSDSKDKSKNNIPEEITYKLKPSQVIRYRVAICEKGIVGWESLKDEDDTLLKFSKENIELLHPDHLEEIAGEISGELKEDAKNVSKPQS